MEKYIVVIQATQGASSENVEKCVHQFLGWKKLAESTWIVCTSHSQEWVKSWLERSMNSSKAVYVVKIEGEQI